MSEKFTPDMRESQKVERYKDNKRVKEIQRRIASLQGQLESVISDLESREKNSNFQRARELFSQGFRLEGWGLQLIDTANETILKKDGKDVGYWADGSSRNTEEAFEIIGLQETDDADEVLSYLNDLSEEE